MIVYLPAALCFAYLGRRTPRAYAFMFLPLAIVLLYAWVGITEPAIETARNALRYVLLAIGSCLDYLLIDYIIAESRK